MIVFVVSTLIMISLAIIFSEFAMPFLSIYHMVGLVVLGPFATIVITAYTLQLIEYIFKTRFGIVGSMLCNINAILYLILMLIIIMVAALP